mmetsp:Transcript_31069/g.68032  ORF Transcript_31069/g.68032 Transcript_31069/m.68032 type:complete len:94 (+) Transcript_31069:881-1162(+)
MNAADWARVDGLLDNVSRIPVLIVDSRASIVRLKRESAAGNLCAIRAADARVFVNIRETNTLCLPILISRNPKVRWNSGCIIIIWLVIFGRSK